MQRMAYTRERAIIAVFGGTYEEAVALAHRVGGVVASRGQILLTGGMRPGTERVSESAIAGAGSSPWVGVARDLNRIEGFESEDGVGFVISTDLGHRRNYLEAHLCDAAVCLLGDEGTRSEATFALSLHRPVAFVGDGWRPNWDLGSPSRPREGVRESLLDGAFTKVGWPPSGRAKLDELLSPTVVKSGLQDLADYKYFSSRIEPEEVVDWVMQSLSSPPNLIGSFPELDGYDVLASKYKSWLETNSI